jgi:hypothetical protein
MKIKTTTLVTAISLAVALVSMAVAVNLSAGNRSAKEEAAGLMNRIAGLEKELALAKRRAKAAAARNAVTNELAGLRQDRENPESDAIAMSMDSGSETNEPPRRRESFEERMARMKEEDPEGYAEFIQRREERQQAMQYNFAERTATIMDLDTSYMTDEEFMNHELLVEKMARIWELTQQFNDPEAPPDREAMRELYNEVREARPMMQEERTVMFRQLGIDLGYDEVQASEFAGHLEEIIESTSLNMPRGGRGGGRGR